MCIIVHLLVTCRYVAQNRDNITKYSIKSLQLLYHANPCNHVLQVLPTTSLVYIVFPYYSGPGINMQQSIGAWSCGISNTCTIQTVFPNFFVVGQVSIEGSLRSCFVGRRGFHCVHVVRISGRICRCRCWR